MSVQTKLRKAKIIAQRAAYNYPIYLKELPKNLWLTTKFFPAALKGELMYSYSELHAVHHVFATGEDIDYGCVSKKKVTYLWVNHLASVLEGLTTSTFSAGYIYHETGHTATAATNSHYALLSSAIADQTGAVRATGTKVATLNAGAPVQTAGIAKYKSIATVTYPAGSTAINEHGLFNASTGNWTGGGITTEARMMDRNVVSPAITPGAGDSITFTYEVTLNAGT